MTIRHWLSVGATAAGLAAACPAQATPAYYQITATNGFVYNDSPLTSFSATVLFDPALVNTGADPVYEVFSVLLDYQNKVYGGAPGSSSGAAVVGEQRTPYPFGPYQPYITLTGSFIGGGGYFARFGLSNDGSFYSGGGSGTVSFTINGVNRYAESIRFQISAAPEASTWAMMMVGLGTVGGMLRRARRTARRVCVA